MRRVFGLLAAFGMVAALFFGLAPAYAGTLDFGPPGQPGISDFTPVTLNGTPQLTSLSIAPFSVIDATASGAGWNVNLIVSDLANGGSVIPASSMAMAAPVVTAVPPAVMTGVAGNATAGNLATGEKIVTADAGDGDGTYLVSPAILRLTVPPNSTAGTYTATATIAVVSGP